MKKTFVALTVLAISFPAFSDPVKDFLVDCGYGTLAGTLLGVASVAFSENPSEKSMNIARGASLGLYAGIGYGLYESNQPRKPSHDVRFWFEPQFHLYQADGMKVSLVPIRF